MKRLTNSDLIGKSGVSLVSLRISEIGFLFHETGSVEAGTDGFVEIRDPSSGDMLSAVFRLQSKATKDGRAWQQETENCFQFPCKERDISDWVASNVPVVLVCCDVARQLAYWKDVTTYFKDPANRESRRVRFEKAADKLDAGAGPALMQVAIPSSAGMHIPPPRRQEGLLSNLMPVIEHPKHMWVAPAVLRKMWDVEETLRAAGVGVECFLRGGQLLSFRPLEEPVWSQVCDVAGVERFDSADWAMSDNLTKQHEFAELLRRALAEKVRDQLDYDRREKLFYFRAGPELRDVRVSGGRRVFRVYRRRDGEISYCRHLGFRAQFTRIGGVWHLEISPQYRFTRDGQRVSRYQGEYVAKIKRLEHNDAVRQQVQAIANHLVQAATLLTPEYRFLAFGPLLHFEVDFGFDEAAWQAQGGEIREQPNLFDAA
jgi:hypothetical protein